jgi:hypothetical protein
MPIQNPQNSIRFKINYVSFIVDEGMQILMTTKRINFKGSQKNQDLWNRYLSWFYVQQNLIESLYSGKAIYKRNPESLSNIVNLAQLAIEEEMKCCQGNSWLCFRKHARFRTAYSSKLID